MKKVDGRGDHVLLAAKLKATGKPVADPIWSPKMTTSAVGLKYYQGLAACFAQLPECFAENP
jgi:hypothetical protein